MTLCLAPTKVRSLPQANFSVSEMRKMIKELQDDVEIIEKSNIVSEDLYNKLEQKVKKKFNEEVERLEKSFRRIIE